MTVHASEDQTIQISICEGLPPYSTDSTKVTNNYTGEGDNLYPQVTLDSDT